MRRVSADIIRRIKGANSGSMAAASSAAKRAAPAATALSGCPAAHQIGRLLQHHIIIYLRPFQLQRRPHPALLLLHHVPGLVRPVPLLARPDMNRRTLCVRQRLQRGGLDAL